MTEIIYETNDNILRMFINENEIDSIAIDEDMKVKSTIANYNIFSQKWMTIVKFDNGNVIKFICDTKKTSMKLFDQFSKELYLTQHLEKYM